MMKIKGQYKHKLSFQARWEESAKILDSRCSSCSTIFPLADFLLPADIDRSHLNHYLLNNTPIIIKYQKSKMPPYITFYDYKITIGTHSTVETPN